LESLEDRTLLSATLPSGGLTPAQIEHAYGFDLIQFAGGIKGDGSGQTIAIVDELDDPNIASDLHAFDLQFGIAEHSGFFTKVEIGSPGPSGNTGDAIETSMDVEWVHALAPGANIVLVEAANDAQIVPAMGAAASISGVSVVSLSFGAPESDAQSSSLGWYPAFETIGAQHPGVTFVVSSGDEHNGEIVDYPSTSTWALSVGATAFYGTSLPVVDPAGDYVHEEVWNSGRDNASAGGPSTLIAAPSWQAAITGSQYRVTPDVSFHGYGSCYVYDSYDYPSDPWSENGGTSVAAPSWAALITIANQGAHISGASNLGHAAIPALYATYQNSDWYAMAFHDVVAGDNNYYYATTGYDWATGLGTPHADAIAEWLGQDVPAPTLSSPPPSVLTSTSATFNWGAVNDAISYQVVLTDNTTGSSVTLSTGGSTTLLSTSASGLISGHSYTFSVWSQLPNLANPGGGANLESSPVASSTTFTVLTSLAAPTLSWPVDNSANPITVTLTPTASWSAVFGASGYYIDLVDQTTSQVVLDSAPVSGTSYTPSTPLTAGDTYEWRVMAYNSGGLQSGWSDYAYTIAEASIPVLSIDNVTLTEAKSGTESFDFTVSISGANTLPASVNFATADGTATAASGDYVATNGTLTWAAGDNTAKTISVTVNGSTAVEPDKTFYVDLSSPTNATLANNTGVGTIVNANLLISSVVVAEATPSNGILESNENLVITWQITSAYSLASQTVTVDGRTITPINGPYSSVYYSCTIGTWAVGDHSYAIQATDSKGVSGSSTGTFTVVAPPNPDPVIGQVVVSQAKGRISWNVVDAAGVAGSAITIDGKSVGVSGPYTASSGVNYSALLGALAAGSHSYTITATDKAGNQGSSTGSFSIVNQGPTISQVAVSAAKNKISWNALSANGVASSTIAIDGKTLGVSGPFTASSGVNFSASLPTLTTGDHAYTITATDKAGNVSTLSGSFAWTAPVSSGPAISQVAVSETKDRISWNVFDADGVAGSTVAIDGKTASSISGPYAASSGVNYSAPLGTLATGQHSYTITATDRAGNVSTLNGNFVLQNQTGPTISQVAVSQTKGRISWNAFDTQGVASSTIQIDGATVANVSGPYAASSGVNFSAPLGSLTAGTHAYKITATDAAGDVSTLSGSFVWGSAGAQNALASAAALSVFSNRSDSAKVDWLYDLGGLLDDTPPVLNNHSSAAGSFAASPE
jgi:hypothetical protein